jgi:hypothetical protein
MFLSEIGELKFIFVGWASGPIRRSSHIRWSLRSSPQGKAGFGYHRISQQKTPRAKFYKGGYKQGLVGMEKRFNISSSECYSIVNPFSGGGWP